MQWHSVRRVTDSRRAPDLEIGSDWGQTRSKTVTWHDPTVTAAAGSALSGLEFLLAIRDGRLPPPPIGGVLGLRL
jgi:hypothetical protein